MAKKTIFSWEAGSAELLPTATERKGKKRQQKVEIYCQCMLRLLVFSEPMSRLFPSGLQSSILVVNAEAVGIMLCPKFQQGPIAWHPGWQILMT